MNDDEPTWGEPPLGEWVAQLLAERWEIPPDDKLRVDMDTKGGGVEAVLTSGSTEIEISVTYRSGAHDRDPWMVLVDALDALFGQLEESGRDHRALPTGEGVSFGGAEFLVNVEKRVPELQRLADRLLNDN
ncbi:MAG: hypothetical protein AAFZ18_01835 [Myxococcota bacterium]